MDLTLNFNNWSNRPNLQFAKPENRRKKKVHCRDDPKMEGTLLRRANCHLYQLAMSYPMIFRVRLNNPKWFSPQKMHV
jgi:hypothetical protein